MTSVDGLRSWDSPFFERGPRFFSHFRIRAHERNSSHLYFKCVKERIFKSKKHERISCH
jgi:hypothetical protein